MATRDHLNGVDADRQSQHTRFARYGRLAPYPAAPDAEQVRCSCDRCGSHLLAVVRPGGAIDGACAVCLSRRVTPVGAHRATA
jgi:hypothetical protein